MGLLTARPANTASAAKLKKFQHHREVILKKNIMKNELIKLADHLDKKGLHKEANYLDALIKRTEVLEKRASLTKAAGIFDQADEDRLVRIEDLLHEVSNDVISLVNHFKT